VDLEKLPGVGPVMAKKLNGVGIFEVHQLLSHAPHWIADETGMDIVSTETLFRKAKTKLGIPPFVSGDDIREERNGLERISTGTKCLDKLLSGGLEPRATTEIYGENGVGKSQFCHTMAVETVHQTGGKVVWIDTEDTFRPERITSIAGSVNLEPGTALENIKVARVYNSSDQKQALEETERIISSENVRLVIIDSATGLFRSEYIGRGTLADRQGRLNEFMTLASNIAQVYGIPVLLTNQIQTSPGILYGDPNRPVGGNIVGHESTYRIYLRKSGGFSVAKLVKSPQSAQTEVIFGITDAGVVDKEIKEELDKAKKKEAKKQ